MTEANEAQAQGGHGEIPLVDRVREFAALTALLEPRSTRRAAVLTGAAGQGRTRLAREWLAAAGARGYVTSSITVTRAAASVPLGALAPLLSRVGRSASVDRLNAARRAIAGDGAAGDTALVVDDAHLLDSASATVLHHVAEREPGVRLLLTVRAGANAPDPIQLLWKDGLAALVDLAPLSEEDIGYLVAATLGGPVTTGTRHLVWRWTGGNPLLARELVQSAVDSDDLRQDGIWRLVDLSTPSRRLRSIVEDHLGGPSDAELKALAAIVVGGPIDVGLVERHSSAAAVEALDAKRLLAFDDDGSARRVRLALPVHQSALRAGMTVTQIGAVARALAASADGGPNAAKVDRRQVAVWRLDSGSKPDRRDLLDAAADAIAMRSPAAALRLARAAGTTPSRGLRLDAAIVAAEALLMLGQYADAVRLLESLEAVADPPRRPAVASLEAVGRLWGLRQPAEAEQVLVAATKAVTDHGWRRRLTAQLAELHLVTGAVDRAGALLPPGGVPAPTPGSAAVDRLDVATSLTLTVRGQCEDAAALATGEEQGPAAMASALALLEAGKVADAEARSRRASRAALEGDDVVGQAAAALLAGRIAWTRGQVQTGRRCYAEAIALFGALGLADARRWALAGRAICEASTGSAAATALTVEAIDALRSPILWLLEPEVDRARAWGRAVRGDERGARDLLGAAATAARRRGAHGVADAALFDLARLGAGAEARQGLAEHSVQGRLAVARRQFAAALATADGAGLDAVSHAFEAMGMVLFAAEAAAAAGAAHRRAASARLGRQSSGRATALAARCEGARTPLLALAGPVIVLTAREREIAGHAARGASNRDIAESLDLSVRTVENNLQRIYVKLGAGNRAELAKLLSGE